MKISKCILCDSQEKLTREHLLLRSLLEKFNDFENYEKNKMLLSIIHGKRGEFSNIAKAKILKPKRNICGKCNSDRSTKCDAEFTNLMWDMYLWGKNNKAVSNLYLPSPNKVRAKFEELRAQIPFEKRNEFSVEGSIVDAILSLSYRLIVNMLDTWDKTLITKYICKHTACYLDRIGYPVPTYIKQYFLNADCDPKIEYETYFLSPKFHFGYHNGGIHEYVDDYEYDIIFSNVMIHVKTHK